MYKVLADSSMIRNRSEFIRRKVSYDSYIRFLGKKARFRSVNLGGSNSRGKQYKYTYYTYTRSAPRKKESFLLRNYYQVLNVDITGYMDQLSHDSIFALLPITDKYLYFIKAWSKSTLIGPKEKRGIFVSRKPETGIQEGTTIGTLVRNIVLDGLYDYLIRAFPKRFQVSKKVGNLLAHITKNPLNGKVLNRPTELYSIRYAENLLIIAKCNLVDLEPVQEALDSFLKERGLVVKNLNAFKGQTFKPGSRFAYLGFSFLLPDLKSSKIGIGRYTKKQYNPASVGYSNSTHDTRSKLLLLIEPRVMAAIKLRFKKLISARNTPYSVSIMIAKVNLLLRGFVTLFKITRSISKQLESLNDLIHRLFYKYLRRKFSSVPRFYQVIKANYLFKGTFCAEGVKLLKVHQVNFN